MDEQPQTLELMDKFTGVHVMCCYFYCTLIMLVSTVT